MSAISWQSMYVGDTWRTLAVCCFGGCHYFWSIFVMLQNILTLVLVPNLGRQGFVSVT